MLCYLFAKKSTFNLAVIVKELSKVASEVIACGFMKLKSAFQLVSPDVLQYKASEARRKLLRMPLACISVGDRSKGT